MSPPTSESFQGVLAIAFHLPQFHPIAEIDEWWSKDLRECAKVLKG
jgi:hypothetical protein